MEEYFKTFLSSRPAHNPNLILVWSWNNPPETRYQEKICTDWDFDYENRVINYISTDMPEFLGELQVPMEDIDSLRWETEDIDSLRWGK